MNPSFPDKEIVKQFVNRMENARKISMSDQEAGHLIADDLLCDLLKLLGYKDFVDKYKEVEKWYA